MNSSNVSPSFFFPTVHFLPTSFFEKEIFRVDKEGLTSNPKALLQEYCQSFSNNVPEYILISQQGPPHNRTFYIDVFFEGNFLASGQGATKKSAQKAAAQSACEKWGLIKGVKNGVQYTVPIENAVNSVRKGENPN